MKIYCKHCADFQPFKLSIKKDTEHPENGIWGDLTCNSCSTAIATFEDDVEGSYEMVKVDMI